MRESVIFKNPGLIEILSVKTLGINVKEGKNPFGYFGTGLKYAIGILLRNGCKITIWRGLEEFNFALKEVEVRGKSFSLVTMNGEELGFTSNIGKNWELWMAYRELYCNTMDENGDVLVLEGSVFPQEEVTTIAVEGESFLNTHRKKREFILQTSPFETYMDKVEIHESSAVGLFYKGILIGGFQHKSKFTYNMLLNVELTEDRTLKSLFSPEWDIVQAIKISKNEHLIKTVATAGENFFEGGS